MKKTLIILSIVALAIGLVKFGEFIGEHRGYSNGWKARVRMEKLRPVDTILKDINTIIRDNNDKCDNELKLAKYLLDIKKEGIEVSELQKVLHPEKVTATKPTNKKKDEKVVDLRDGMEAFDLEACYKKADEKDSLYYQLRARSECWGKNELAEHCTYTEGEGLVECKKEVVISEKEYWSDLYNANWGDEKSFSEEIADKVIEKQEEAKNDN